MAWLPDTHLARAWQEFSKRGAIADSSPPPAPHNIKVKKTDDGVELTWDAVADIESGIGSFRIYRDGKMVREIRGKEDKRWNPHSYYHAWNYSDQPLLGTEFPERKYVDTKSVEVDDASYAVTTVNQAGLESEKATMESDTQED